MIVIKSKMPKSCGSCPMRSERWCNSLHKNVLYTFERLPDCPIVGEIPDKHGDLVELQEVEDMICEESSSSDRDVRSEQLLGLLKGIPVILEAST